MGTANKRIFIMYGMMIFVCHGFVFVVTIWQQNMHHFVTVQAIIQNGRWKDSTAPIAGIAWFRYLFSMKNLFLYLLTKPKIPRKQEGLCQEIVLV